MDHPGGLNVITDVPVREKCRRRIDCERSAMCQGSGERKKPCVQGRESDPSNADALPRS